MLPETNEMIKEKATLDDSYRDICKQLAKGEGINTNYGLKEDILCGKNRINAPEGMRK